MPEALVAALDELDAAYAAREGRPGVPGRARPAAARLRRPADACSRRHPASAEQAGGARILLKREDLNHTGAHKISNVLGQALLTQRMGKTRVIAETGAGQHGVATATAAALFGLECVVYMGEEDTRRQALNVARMRLLGAEVVPVTHRLAHAQGRDQRGAARLGRPTSTPRTTCSARSPARTRSRRWSATSSGSSASRPAQQCLDLTGRLPDAVVRLRRRRLQRDRHLPRVHPRRRRRAATASRPAATASRPAGTPRRITGGAPGVLHGARTYVLQDEDGQTIESHSISAGLDYPGVGPEHAWLHDTGRATYRAGHRRRGDGRVRAAVPDRGHHPGDRERARAGRRAASSAASSARTPSILVNLSGRGDKDVDTAGAVVRAVSSGAEQRRSATAFAKAQRRGPRRRWSATCRPASRPCDGAHRGAARAWSTPASTSSRSGCPTPTR